MRNHNTVKDTLRRGVLTLQAARVESASLDARVLLETALGTNREQLLLHMEDEVTRRQKATYMVLVEKRAARQPVSQLVGKREFWGMEFKVTKDTLAPRPDSETLVEEVLGRLAAPQAPLRILDLGTGTGCLLLALLAELPQATGVGVDISERALAVAMENALRLRLQSRAAFVASDWCSKVEGTFDVVIANPPYIPSKVIDTLAPEVAQFEPRLALDGGEDGLDAYRLIARQLPPVLKQGGLVAFEIGIGQLDGLTALAAEHRLHNITVKHDLSGIPRVVLCEMT